MLPSHLFLLRIYGVGMDKTHFHNAVFQGMQGHIVVFHEGRHASGFKSPYRDSYFLHERIKFDYDPTMVARVHD
ncbi:hypothetical protein [Pollutimonas sp. M17]|uniref:hypothetical protein n=1 Tax=Pollutimonas sp. M17 TaxID=2962065 RepID=UPI0021F49B7A|nr:hypothetical protein [Pollutimonas sp. M17]UYO95001.1 hypothetical protein OEG81_06755 [Pollutimonas sp. M17]